MIGQISSTLLVGKFRTRQNLSDGQIQTNCFGIIAKQEASTAACCAMIARGSQGSVILPLFRNISKVWVFQNISKVCTICSELGHLAVRCWMSEGYEIR